MRRARVFLLAAVMAVGSIAASAGAADRATSGPASAPTSAAVVTPASVATSAPANAPAIVPAGDPRVTPVVMAYQKARPAVVNISAEKVVTSGIGVFGDDPLEDIFPNPMLRRVPVQSLGSGVLIHADGYIVTNAHVVRKAEKITVILTDKRQLSAKIIIADSTMDLAVLKVDLPKGQSLPYLPLGRSDDLMVGETVIAIGNPMGYSNSVTTGVISATDRTLEFAQGIRYAGLIQTDAPINPGNSGGPLLNIKGELIGINTAIRADAQNIGFAIPADLLAAKLAELMDFERINRVIFGAAVAPRHGPSGDELVVVSVRKGTPADGLLKENERLLRVDGKVLAQVPDYAFAMIEAKPGQTVTLTVLRGGKEVAVPVALAAKPRPDGKALAEKMLGVTLRAVTPELAKDMRLTVDRGLVVVAVDVGGPADKIGVQVRDVVFQLDRFFTGDMDDLGTAMEDVKAGQTMRIGVVRRNIRAWVGITTRSAAPASQKADGKETI